MLIVAFGSTFSYAMATLLVSQSSTHCIPLLMNIKYSRYMYHAVISWWYYWIYIFNQRQTLYGGRPGMGGERAFLPVLLGVMNNCQPAVLNMSMFKTIVAKNCCWASWQEWNTPRFITLSKTWRGPIFPSQVLLHGSFKEFDSSLIYYWIQSQFGSEYQSQNHVKLSLKTVSTMSACKVCRMTALHCIWF